MPTPVQRIANNLGTRDIISKSMLLNPSISKFKMSIAPINREITEQTTKIVARAIVIE